MSRAGLNELNAVVAVAEHKSFRAAATVVGLSPSALSHLIAALETRLGVRLFHRTTRSVSLSAAGEAFLARVQPALAEIDAALESINDHRDTPTGLLRLNASKGAVRFVVMPIVLEYLRCYPDMRVDIISDDQLVDIVAGGFDAGVRGPESMPQDMVTVPIGPAVRFAVVAHPLCFATRPPPTTPADLVDHACVRWRLPSGSVYRWELEKDGEEVIVDVGGPLIVNDDVAALEAVLGGAGLAYMSEWSVADDIAAGRLVRVLEDWSPPWPPLRLYWPGHRHMSAGLRAFVDLVRERQSRDPFRVDRNRK